MKLRANNDRHSIVNGPRHIIPRRRQNQKTIAIIRRIRLICPICPPGQIQNASDDQFSQSRNQTEMRPSPRNSQRSAKDSSALRGDQRGHAPGRVMRPSSIASLGHSWAQASRVSVAAGTVCCHKAIEHAIAYRSNLLSGCHPASRVQAVLPESRAPK